jgi:FG-GAP-like repeat
LKRGVALAALLGALSGCTNFPSVQDEQCGNVVLDPDEDCDTFVNGHPGAECRGPGMPGACRFDCSEQPDGKRHACPKDMVCSREGICRHATYEFEEPEVLSSDYSSWLSTVDFDHDGRSEIVSAEPSNPLQQARFRLHYFDDDSQLEETRVFPRPTGRPVVRKLEEGRAEDLVFTNFQIGMIRGREDRAFVPATFSSYIVENGDLRTVSVSDGLVDQWLGLVAFSTVKGESVLLIPSVDRKLTPARRLEGPISELVSEPLTAALVTAADSPCDEVVFAFRGAHEAHVLDVCELGADPLAGDVTWRREFREQAVRLPDGRQLDSRPLAADVNGDGHLDLLLGSAGETFVAYGDGEHLEGRAARLDLPFEGAQGPLALPTPLAAGDLTGDGVADYVLPTQLWGSRTSLIDGSTVYFPSFANLSLPWTTAVVGDLNGNQLPDVIAATEGEFGLSFVSGSGGPYPVGQRLATRGAVHFLTTGDFDGDRIGDVAYIERPVGSHADVLAVAYGARDKAPLSGVHIADVDGVQQLGRERDGGLDSIFTTSTDESDGMRRGKFTLFAGDPSRLPFAPYFLVTFASDNTLEDNLSPTLIAGSFVRPGQGDVLSLGMTTPDALQWTQWLLPNVSRGSEQPLLLTEADPPKGAFVFTSTSATDIQLSAAGVASDLNGDGLDEAVWIMPEGRRDGRGPCALLVSRIDAESLDGESPDGKPDPSEKPTLVQLQRLSFTEPCPAPVLQAADLNNDERPELLLLIGDPAAAARQLQILWNDGAGAFSLDERSFIAAPKSRDIRSFAMFPDPSVVPNYGLRLAFVTASELFTAAPRSDARRWVVERGPGSYDDARSVVVADTNGDSFLEAVVADARGLWRLAAGRNPK